LKKKSLTEFFQIIHILNQPCVYEQKISVEYIIYKDKDTWAYSILTTHDVFVGDLKRDTTLKDAVKCKYIFSPNIYLLFTNIVVFWVIKPCSLVGCYQSFGGTYCLHVQCEILSRWQRRKCSYKRLVPTYQLQRKHEISPSYQVLYPTSQLVWSILSVTYCST
jgi:hypothetical protein